MILNEGSELRGSGKGREKGRNEKAAAAALVTQFATALVCSAHLCRGKLGAHAHSVSFPCYKSSAVVKVTSSLDWKSHSKDVFSSAGLNLKLACVQPVQLKVS